MTEATPVRFHYRDEYAALLHGEVLDALATLPAASVHCVVTSVPYWGLRDYGTGEWEGGDPGCSHQPLALRVGATTLQGGQATNGHQQEGYGPQCGRCGARRVDGQLGMEALHDCLGWATGEKCGACYICHMVEVFAEVKRVLRPEGTLWLNIGDAYAGSGKGQMGDGTHAAKHGEKQHTNKGAITGGRPRFRSGWWRTDGSHNENNHLRNRNGIGPVPGLKAKDLVLMPARLALALQAAGWYVRSHIVWAKRSPMPESVQDRPTNAHETVWLLTKG